jgi:hypothetical protein
VSDGRTELPLCSLDNVSHFEQSARVMMGPGPGLRWSRLYPAEGDSALAELTSDGLVWGEARLENIGLTEVGEARIAGARVVLRLFASEDGGRPLEFDLDQVNTLLAEARAWLLENEQGRLPLPE